MNTISAMNGIFPVAKLSAWKGKEIEEGMFLVRKIEKGTGKDSLGCVVPACSQESFVRALENGTVFESMLGLYQGQWNDYLKEKLVEGASLYASDLELAGFVAWLEAEEVKAGRVSKEKIGAWFDFEVAKVLKAAFYEKLGQVENEKMVGILKAYKVNFMSLAKRELSLPDAVRVNLGKALELLGDSGMKSYCEKKLKETEKKEVDLMEAL